MGESSITFSQVSACPKTASSNVISRQLKTVARRYPELADILEKQLTHGVNVQLVGDLRSFIFTTSLGSSDSQVASTLLEEWELALGRCNVSDEDGYIADQSTPANLIDYPPTPKHMISSQYLEVIDNIFCMNKPSIVFP